MSRFIVSGVMLGVAAASLNRYAAYCYYSHPAAMAPTHAVLLAYLALVLAVIGLVMVFYGGIDDFVRWRRKDQMVSQGVSHDWTRRPFSPYSGHDDNIEIWATTTSNPPTHATKYLSAPPRRRGSR